MDRATWAGGILPGTGMIPKLGLVVWWVDEANSGKLLVAIGFSEVKERFESFLLWGSKVNDAYLLLFLIITFTTPSR